MIEGVFDFLRIKMNKPLAIVSSLVPYTAMKRLREDFNVLALLPDEDIDAPVSTHPDMLMFIFEENAVIPRRYADEHQSIPEALANYGIKVILSDKKRTKTYPNDVNLNCAVIGDTVVARLDSADEQILTLAKKNGLRTVNVKQGYAACSCLTANFSVLTSDRGIYKALMQNNIGARLFSGGKIILDGYGCGFIGGCGGVFEDKLYLFGESAETDEFAHENNLTIVRLLDGILTDFGGIKFIKGNSGNV